MTRKVGQKTYFGGCTTCQVGRYQPEMEQKTCKECPYGRTSLEESALCSDCVMGKVRPPHDEGHTKDYSCRDCESGKISLAEDTVCKNLIIVITW